MSAPPSGCTSKCRCGFPFASPESPFHATCSPAETLRAVRNREGDVLDAAAAVVVPRGQVVVQVDVHVHRPAAPVEVEHAAAEPGLGVRDPSRLDRDDRRAPRVLHVDAGMAVRPARVAVVVPEVGLRDEREDEPRDTRAAGRLGAARGHERSSGQETGEEREENPSGCRPVASHVTGGAPVRARRAGR